MEYTALIVAAGAGTRMGLGYNKAYYRMEDGATILEHTMRIFSADPECVQTVVVTDPETYQKEIGEPAQNIVVTAGGDSREESVWNGMRAVMSEIVLIHDGARPFLPESCLNDLKAAMETEEAACLMVPCKDTIKVVAGEYIEKTLKRSELMAAQTPQAFRTQLLIRCMKKAQEQGFEATDDCSIVEAFSDTKIRIVEGSYANKKITTMEDL